MEKIKFGIQVVMLLLAFPAWFFAEMKQADKEIKKNQPVKVETIEVKGTVNSEFTTAPSSKLMITNN